MDPKNIGKSFVQEFVIGFGFLSGLWIHLGINPETELIKALSSIIMELSPNPTYSFAFWIIPIIGIFVSISGSYFIAKWPGLIAVFFAFIGGIFINSTIGIFFLAIGILLGFVAPYIKN